MNWSEITIDALRGALGISAAAYALAAIGLNLQFGFTGLMNFGHVASIAVGAYGAAIAIEHDFASAIAKVFDWAGAGFAVGAVEGSSLVVAILCGLVASAALSIILGFTALRLRLDYLAMATLATGEVLRLILRSRWADPVTNSVYGINKVGEDFFALNPFPPLHRFWNRSIGSIHESFAELNPFPSGPSDRVGLSSLGSFWAALIFWGLVAIGTLVAYRLMKGSSHPTIEARHSDGNAACILGKNVLDLRMQSFVLGTMLGALLGVVGFSDLSSFWEEAVFWSLVSIGALALFLLIMNLWTRFIKPGREGENAARGLGIKVFVLCLKGFVIGGVLGTSLGIIGFGNLSYDGRTFWVMTVCWSLVAIGTLFVYLMIKSPWGRSIKAVREDEYAARSLGKNVFGLRTQSFIVGGMFGALTGIILAFDRNVDPTFYPVQFTFQLYAAMLIGGPGTVMGPIVGVIIYWFAFEWFEGFISDLINLGWFTFTEDETGWVATTVRWITDRLSFDKGTVSDTSLSEPDDTRSIIHLLELDDSSAIRYMFLGLVLVLLVVFRPQGLLGKKSEELLNES